MNTSGVMEAKRNIKTNEKKMEMKVLQVDE